MINVNELRKNNWLERNGIPVQVDEITSDTIGHPVGSEFLCSSHEQLDPIELTPGILEKAGFVKGVIVDSTEENGWYGSMFEDVQSFHSYDVWHISDFIIGLRDNEWHLLRIGACYDESTDFYVIAKFNGNLHILMNIFYFLTQTELKITL